MCMGAHEAKRGHLISWILSYRQLWAGCWIELQLSRRVGSVLNYWANPEHFFEMRKKGLFCFWNFFSEAVLGGVVKQRYCILIILSNSRRGLPSKSGFLEASAGLSPSLCLTVMEFLRWDNSACLFFKALVFFYVSECLPGCMWISRACLMPTELRRLHCVRWNWSYWGSWDGVKPAPMVLLFFRFTDGQ